MIVEALTEMEYFPANKDCRDWRLWHKHPEDGATPGVCSCELETLLFIKALVGLLKPRLIVELGINAGIAAEYFLLGYPEATLLGMDYDKRILDLAEDRLQPYSSRTILYLSDAAAEKHCLPHNSPLDLLFVDTAGDTRLKEMRLWIPRLSQFGICLVHDTDTRRTIRKETETVAQELGLQIIHLPTPRGLTLMRKPFKESE